MKLDYPATSRNRSVIADYLTPLFSGKTRVLELAAGSGQHGDFLTQNIVGHSWQPTEVSDEGLLSISTYQKETLERKTSWLKPIKLDVSSANWNVGKFDLIFVANLFHISPISCTENTFRQVPKHLTEGGEFVVYGPFLDSSIETSPSNIEFNNSLKDRNESWGIRSLVEVEGFACSAGLKLVDKRYVPSHNMILKFQL